MASRTANATTAMSNYAVSFTPPLFSLPTFTIHLFFAAHLSTLPGLNKPEKPETQYSKKTTTVYGLCTTSGLVSYETTWLWYYAGE
jgi:hypothetical protein